MFEFNMDAHMHFDLYKNREEILDYIERQKSYTLAMTNLPSLYKKYREIYSQYNYTKIALGFHPELVKNYYHQIDIFERICKDTRYIGEVGLDFTTDDLRERKMQEEIFVRVVEASSRYGKKIMSVHTRRAAKPVLDILTNFNGGVIFHWFSGNLTELQEAVNRDYYFSLNHQMLRSTSGKTIINNIPVDRILIESDAPFTKGMEEIYDMRLLNVIYNYIAELYAQDITTVKKRIKLNFIELLNQREDYV